MKGGGMRKSGWRKNRGYKKTNDHYFNSKRSIKRI